MKFRKRKDIIQRKNFNQQEINSILHSYLLKQNRQADYVPTIYTELSSLQNEGSTITKEGITYSTIKNSFLVNTTVTNLKGHKARNYDYKKLFMQAKDRLQDQLLKIEAKRQAEREDSIANKDSHPKDKVRSNTNTCQSPSFELSNLDICL